MAIAFVRSATSSGSGSAGGTTNAAVYGATPTSGDLLVGVVRAINAVATPTGPAGWAMIQEVVSGTTRFSLWWKVAGAAEPTSVSFTEAATTNMRVVLLEYSGTATSSPVDNSTSAVGASSTTTTIGPMATTAPNTVVVAAVGMANGHGGMVSWSDSFIERINESGNTMAAAGRIVSAAASYQTTPVWTTSRQSYELMASFKQAPATITATMDGTNGAATGTLTATRTVDATMSGAVAATLTVYRPRGQRLRYR